ncbi:MAG: alanine--glyoxylate aminotransferase family protein [Campylobacterales bacterium]|nr:alanine--glyoxylate aminotransferase family protein [Campylobacterales bacterium]
MLLFTPGPTPVLESVRQAMATATLHHRTPEFEAIFKEARENLIRMFNMPEAVMFASSGTGAMQSAFLHLCKSKALTINSGKFGERFGKIADAFNIPKVELKYEWDTPASLDDVKEALEANPDIDAIFIQISESAGGLRHPVEAIAALAKEFNPDIMIVADGITAVGVEPIDTTHIDALITGSQKALMLPPGLAMIGLSNSAIAKIGEGVDYYFNLALELKKQRENTTAYTAATTLIIGLNAMFNEIEKAGGFEVLYSDTARRAKATLAALNAIGLQSYPVVPALSMTTVMDENAEAIRKLLKNKYGVNMAGGQDHLKGKIFRINQMGLIPVYESAWVVNAIEMALDELGKRAYDGLANRVFNEIYYKENE